MQIGDKYMGSPSLQISEAYQELVPEKKLFYKFSFINQQECTVKINDSEPIYLGAHQGFAMNHIDRSISSFVIVEDGITFNFLAGLR